MMFRPLPLIYKLMVDKNTRENRMAGTGIFLMPFEERKGVPKKIYGAAMKDVTRYWNKFVKVKHSIGVMLLGDAGSGKTLVAELLANLALDNNLPVIQITETKVDLDVLSYISNLKDCVILFDEFSKNVDYHMQSKMLTMMTDKSGGKKLFIITENERSSISRFIVNRPGRAFYSKDYDKLEIETLIEYLNDFPVSEKFKEDLLEKYKTTLTFSFDHLTALVSEHIDYPNDSIEELLEYLNVDLFTKPIIYTIDKVFATDNETKVIEYNHIDIDAKEFTAGRYFYAMPKSHTDPSLKISNKNVVNMDDRTITLKQGEFTIILNKSADTDNNSQSANNVNSASFGRQFGV